MIVNEKMKEEFEKREIKMVESMIEGNDNVLIVLIKKEIKVCKDRMLK